MSFGHIVLVSKFHVRVITISVTDLLRSLAFEAGRLLLIALISAEKLASILCKNDLLALIRLSLHVWQPVLGLPVFPIVSVSR